MFNSDKQKTAVKEKTVKPNKITAGKLIIAFLAVFIPVTALKAYHMLKFTDSETGFFLDRTDITVYLFYIILVAGVLLITLLSYLSARGGNLPGGEVFRKRDIVGGILSLGTAAFLGFRAYDIYSELAGIAESYGVSLFAASKLEHHNVFYFGQLIFAALGALWLIYYAVSRFAGKDFCTKLRVLSLAPAVWGACRVIEFFTVTISYLNVAELFCDIFTAVLGMIFLFCLARCAADVEGDNAVWSVFASGLSLAVVGISAQAIRIFFMVSGRSGLLVTDRPFSALFFSLSLLGLWTVVSAASYKKKPASESASDWEVADSSEPAQDADIPAAAPSDDDAAPSAVEADEPLQSAAPSDAENDAQAENNGD